MKERNHVHYFIGKNSDIGPNTKTGCGLKADEVRQGLTFDSKQDMLNKVTCEACRAKVKSVLNLKK